MKNRHHYILNLKRGQPWEVNPPDGCVFSALYIHVLTTEHGNFWISFDRHAKGISPFFGDNSGFAITSPIDDYREVDINASIFSILVGRNPVDVEVCLLSQDRK